jgi:hypothetical protein
MHVEDAEIHEVPVAYLKGAMEVFLELQGIMDPGIIPEDSTVNKVVFTCLRKATCLMHPEMCLPKDWVILHDNVTAKGLLLVQTKLWYYHSSSTTSRSFAVLLLPLSIENGMPEGASLQVPLKVIMQNT